jgi:type II secretory ATPase GspE/PulE/Tfp pilus assembly ATPase PilB-like protein
MKKVTILEEPPEYFIPSPKAINLNKTMTPEFIEAIKKAMRRKPDDIIIAEVKRSK